MDQKSSEQERASPSPPASSGPAQAQATEPTAASTSAGAAAQPAPRGVPSLPPRGLPSLPPKKPPAAQAAQQQPLQEAAAGPDVGAGSGSSAAGASQQQTPSTAQPPAAAPASGSAGAPSGLGGGLPKLPPKPSGIPGLPARGGPSLPPRSAPPAASSSSAPAVPPAPAPAPAAAAPAAAAAAATAQQPPPPQQQAAAAPSATTSAAPAPSGGATRPALPARGLGGSGFPSRPGGAAAPPAGAPPGAAPGALRPGFLSRPSAAAPSPASTSVASAPPPSAEVVDPSEDKKAQQLQRKVQDLRVALIRAAMRLGMRYESDSVLQYMQAIERVERMAGEGVYKSPPRRVDLNRAAEREAREAEGQEPPDSKLPIKIKILLIGMTGTGKSELINALLGRQAQSTNAFKDSTKRVRVVRGVHQGVQLEFIDTPGLHAAASAQAENKAVLRAVRSAYKRHKPHYVFYVDRLDTAKAALGELTLLSQINETLGAPVWRQTMVVLTHAHAARAVYASQFTTFLQQRKHYMQQLIRQAAGDMQARNPFHVVDSHPACPTNSLGQAIVLDGTQTIPWKQAVVMMLVGYRSYEQVQAMFIEAAKKKGAKPKPATKQDMFKQMMRGRLPPMTFFVEQMTEGVLKPDTWAGVEDPFGQETECEEAEEFSHVYYGIMYDMAARGHAGAQQEYAAMLRRLRKIQRTYKKEVYEAEDWETLGTLGYEGTLSPGLDLGTTFDPEDINGFRYAYAISDPPIAVMPTMDYYGFEHEDAITGFVAEWEGQPLNRHGWGGIPVDITVTIEKDKTTTCLQAEGIFSLVHAVQPFANRHISQVRAACELLRPNLKDVLYQLEINTFKDGLLRQNDHAGCGVLLTRLGEGGKVGKGPVGYGLRLQETFRVGPFKVEAVAAKVQCDTPTGTKEEGWGARAFVAYDHLPGLGMVYDFFQERTPENAEAMIRGWAGNWTHDLQIAGCASSVEVDYVAKDEALHVSMKLFSIRDYRLGWLLLLPAWNYARGKWQNWRAGVQEEPIEDQEGEEEEEAEEDDQFRTA